MLVPESYMVLDVESGNSLATFHERSKAEACLVSMVREYPARAENLALVTFDKTGAALSTELAEDLGLPV